MIELDFFESTDKFGVVKATIHKTGKLGFSSGASKYMNLDETKFYNIGMNKSNTNDKSLYLVPVNTLNDKSFKVIKAGDYFYIFIKNILRDLKIDYKNETIIYDIEEMESENNKYYKLIKREKK